MDTFALAWAAGFFDAEGSISQHLPTRRRTRRPTLDVSQKGDSNPPTTLRRFREVIGAGSLFGPYRGSLYYWRTHDVALITSVVMLLWPWLSAGKRAQIRSTIAAVPGLWCAEGFGEVWDAHVRRTACTAEERAWAAGFFEGDGSIGAYHNARSRGLVLSASIWQADDDGIPACLARFADAVAIGAIHGPYRPRGWSRLPQYRWQVNGRGVEVALSRLRPWMVGAKRDRADMAIQAARRSRPLTCDGAAP